MRLLRLSTLNLLVMGSTFLFFSTSVRIAESIIAANFIIFGLAQSTSSLLSDSGKTNLAFRHSLRDPNHKYEIYSNLLRTRIKRNLPIQILTLPIFMVKNIGLLAWLIFLVVSTIVILYSIGLSLVQAEESYNTVYVIQLLNGIGFIVSTSFLSRIDKPSLNIILIHLLAAWVPVSIFISKSVLRLLQLSKRYDDNSEDKRYFSRILYANIVTLNYNPFILGIFSSHLLILYTVSSMPITMLMPISASLSTLASHRFRIQSFESSMHQIVRSMYFLPIALIIALISIPLISNVIGLFFGTGYIVTLVLQIQIISAILSLYTGLYGNLYSISLLSRENRTIAYSQAFIILLLGTAGSLLQSLIIVALSDLLARGVGLLLAIRSSSKPRRKNTYE
jgi:hypothetical protein